MGIFQVRGLSLREAENLAQSSQMLGLEMRHLGENFWAIQRLNQAAYLDNSLNQVSRQVCLWLSSIEHRGKTEGKVGKHFAIRLSLKSVEMVLQLRILFFSTVARSSFYMKLKGKVHIYQIKCTNRNACRDNHKYTYLFFFLNFGRY